MSRRGFSLLFAMILTMLVVGIASAAPPAITRFSGSNEVFKAAGSFCDYDVIYHEDYDFEVKVFFDNDGTPIRRMSHVHAHNGFYPAAHPENELTGVWVGHTTVDLLTGEYSGSGVYFNITAPGFGPVYLVVGHEVFDGDGNVLQYVGPEIVDIPALCAAMAP